MEYLTSELASFSVGPYLQLGAGAVCFLRREEGGAAGGGAGNIQPGGRRGEGAERWGLRKSCELRTL